jgi:hypothetical protein
VSAPELAPDAPFTRRGALVLAGVAALSLVAAGVLGAFGDVLGEPPTALADAWSPSAVGHRAYLALLRDLGVPVIVSRHRTADRTGDAVVAILEPAIEEDEEGPRRETLVAIDGEARRLLVVLPKRAGTPDPIRRRWIGRAALEPVAVPQRVLEALDLDGEVIRPDRSIAAWRGPLPAPSVDEPQLLRGSGLVPLVACAEGLLAGERVGEGWHTVVVADPDVLATHGLGRGDNAALAVALVERLGAGPDRPLVVDETLHGHESQPSLAHELLRFPLVLATAQAAIVGMLLGWAALVRFGRPRPAPPLLAPGKSFLVENTAELLRHGGHLRHAAAAYLRAAKDEIVARLRPPGEAGAADAWLARTAGARGRARDLRRLEERVAKIEDLRHGAEAETVRAAQAIHRWRQEMTDGAAGNPGRDRSAEG